MEMSRATSLSYGKLVHNKKKGTYTWSVNMYYGNSHNPNIVVVEAKKGEMVDVDVLANFRFRKKTMQETIELNKKEFKEDYQKQLLETIDVRERLLKTEELKINKIEIKENKNFVIGRFSIEGITDHVSMTIINMNESIRFYSQNVEFDEEAAECIKQALFSHPSQRLRLLPYKSYKVTV